MFNFYLKILSIVSIQFLIGSIVTAATCKPTVPNSALVKDGTLVIPSFTYSFNRNESFDVDRTKSSLGNFSESFRKMDDVTRTRQPIFSFCSLGKHSELFCSSDITDCFGELSGFGLLHSLNAKLMK